MLHQDLLKEFLFDCKLRRLSERTIKTYRENISKFIRYIRDEFDITEMEDTTYRVVQAYIISLTELDRKERYINNIIKNIKSYYKFLVLEGYTKNNIIDKVSYQKEKPLLIETFSNDEVAKMIRYNKGSKFLEARNHLIMILLFDSGIRNSELNNILVADIKETYIKINGKGSKIRHIPITASINKALIKYIRVRTKYVSNKSRYDDEYLFFSQHGHKLTATALEHIVKSVAVACGVRDNVRASPHTCRHYYAQTQLKNGCDLYTLSKLLGHNNINITKTYLNSMQNDDLMEMASKTSPLNFL